MKSKFANLGNFLREKREARGITQAEVASVLGCKSQFISNWERGAAAPPWPMLRAVVRLYKVDGREIVRLLVGEYEKMVRRELGLKRK